jgi:hypothetical protein
VKQRHPATLTKKGGTLVVSDLLLGGFFLTKPVVDSPKLERVPLNKFLTVSKCLGDFVPDDWVYWNSEERRTERAERAEALGIDVDHLEDLKTWCTNQYTERHTLGYPNVIFDIETARAVVERLGVVSDGPLILLGIGLPFAMSGEFFQRLRAVKSGSREISIGIPIMLQKGVTLPEGEESLGFDALGYESRGTFHSSKCYKVDDSEVTQISFNSFGYCSTLLDAERLTTVHSRGSPERVVWLPWEIRRYSL